MNQLLLLLRAIQLIQIMLLVVILYLWQLHSNENLLDDIDGDDIPDGIMMQLLQEEWLII